jgi:tripartite ATP-independent transporter DctP family solute receptor
MRRIFFGALMLALASLTANAQELVLKAGHAAAATEPFHKGFERFAEIVAEKSGGKIKVEIFPSGQLGTEREMIEQMIVGTLDFETGASAFWTNFVPEMKPFDVPYLVQGWEHMARVQDSPEVLALINKYAQAKGLRVLALNNAGIHNVMSKKPINSLADMAGLKIRVIPNPVYVSAFQMMGANPTPLAYSELYGALQTGVVDAATAANTNYVAQKFTEVAPKWATIGWIAQFAPFGMSEQTYQKLDAEQRKIIEEAAIEAAKYETELYRKSEEDKLASLPSLGVEVTNPDQAPFVEAVKDLRSQVLSGGGDTELADLIDTLK